MGLSEPVVLRVVSLVEMEVVVVGKIVGVIKECAIGSKPACHIVTVNIIRRDVWQVSQKALGVPVGVERVHARKDRMWICTSCDSEALDEGSVRVEAVRSL